MNCFAKAKQGLFPISLLFLLFLVLGTSVDVQAQKRKKNKKSKKAQAQIEMEAPPAPKDTVKRKRTGYLMWGEDSLATVQLYSLYREYYKQGNYDLALPYWRELIDTIPKTRITPYIDGVKMYRSMADAATDSLEQQAYIDTVLNLYDKRIEYFGGEGDLSGSMALIYQKYRKADKENYYGMMRKAVDVGQEDAPYYALVPYFNEQIVAYKKKNLSIDSLRQVQLKLSEIVSYNVENEHKYADRYEARLEKIEGKMESIEENIMGGKIKGARSCDEIQEFLVPIYRENPNDVVKTKRLYSRLRKAKCPKDALFVEVMLKVYALDKTASQARYIATYYYNAGDTPTAVRYFMESIEMESDPTKNAKIYMNLARIERQKVSDLTSEVAKQAREYAQKAADLRAGWGDPYLFIGNLYASSGPLCGTGRGWNSQVVSWVAVDMWNKAKSIDPSTDAEANKNIRQYTQYFPQKSEIFLKTLQEGQSYFVPCWIQRNTRIRGVN